MTTTPKPDAGGHTAGPWRYFTSDRNNGSILLWVIESATRGSMAILEVWKVGDAASDKARAEQVETIAEVEANARLIAASPDLLAALKSLRDIIHDDLTHAQQQHHAEAINFADLVIAKATKGVE